MKPPGASRRKSTAPSKKRDSVGPMSPKKRTVQHRRSTETSQSNTRRSLDVSRRTYHFKRGTKALREIKALQRTTNLLIPKASFGRVVREVMDQYSYLQLRIQPTALQALQEAAEMYMTQFFEDSLLCTLHAKRVTLMAQDCQLMRRLRGPGEVANR